MEGPAGVGWTGDFSEWGGIRHMRLRKKFFEGNFKAKTIQSAA